MTSCRSLEPQRWRIRDYKAGSAAHENKPWLDKYAGYAPEELPLLKESMTCFFEGSVKRVPDVDALRRFDETISYSELNDSASRRYPFSAPRRRPDEIYLAVASGEGVRG